MESTNENQGAQGNPPEASAQVEMGKDLDGSANASPASPKPKIFAFINGGGGDMLMAAAISEDGYGLSGHCSSSIGWAKHDMGIGSDWKHDEYTKHYPQGWELEWVDNPRNHAGVMKAVALHNARHDALESAKRSAEASEAGQNPTTEGAQ